MIFLKNIVIFSFFLVLFSSSAYSLSFAASPSSLSLSSESEDLYIFNPDNSNIYFSSHGCNGTIDMIRSGIIKNNSRRKLTIHPNNNILKQVNCTLDITVLAGFYKSGFSIPVSVYPEKQESEDNKKALLTGFFAKNLSNNKKDQSSSSPNIIWISIAAVIFIIAIIIIMKYG